MSSITSDVRDQRGDYLAAVEELENSHARLLAAAKDLLPLLSADLNALDGWEKEIEAFEAAVRQSEKVLPEGQTFEKEMRITKVDASFLNQILAAGYSPEFEDDATIRSFSAEFPSGNSVRIEVVNGAGGMEDGSSGYVRAVLFDEDGQERTSRESLTKTVQGTYRLLYEGDEYVVTLKLRH